MKIKIEHAKPEGGSVPSLWAHPEDDTLYLLVRVNGEYCTYSLDGWNIWEEGHSETEATSGLVQFRGKVTLEQ